MPATPVEHLEPLLPIIGRWRTSGTILDENGDAAAAVAGTDTYRWLPGGHWVVHEVDVMMGDERTQVLELIGGHDPATGGWQMHAFDTADSPGAMSLTLADPGLFLLQGDGVRSWFRPTAGPGFMTTRWERTWEENWIPWIDMRFDRDD